ncbi:MAG TPA: hypothetical protein VN083_03305, partial [Vicinamibacteria bacterium]|nr:hypothetical protein [Vicinamibacteria bacterium]
MSRDLTLPETPSSPPVALLDLRVRRKAGRGALVFAAVLVLLAFFRPLAPGINLRFRLGVALVLGLGVAGSALLASLRGHGTMETFAFLAFLALSIDGLGQIVSGFGWPVWPVMALLVASVAVAERLPTALAVAGLSALLAGADLFRSPGAWREVLAMGLGYLALVLSVNRALKGEKRRLSMTLAELARLRHGIDQLDDADGGSRPTTATAQTLRQVSEEGRKARQLDRA